MNDLLDHKTMSGYQWLIVFLCILLNFNDGIDVLIVSFSSTNIINEWSLTKTQMGYIFSAGLLGMMLGALGIAPFGDTWGRKKIFILSLFLITIGMILVSMCTSYAQLISLRFLTGSGIGGLLPILAATASEFSNNKYRDFNVSLVQAGWPIGAILTGFLCAYSIPHFGWRSAFFITGCFSAGMLVLVFLFMQDSLDYLNQIQPAHALKKINRLRKRMNLETLDTLPSRSIAIHTFRLSHIFSAQYKRSTYLLWTAVFFGFLTLYTLMSWIPNIAKERGLPFESATYIGIVLNIGAAIGTASLGYIAGRFGLIKTNLVFLFSACLVMLLYGNMSLTTGLVFVLIFLIGLFVQGGFNGLYPIMSRVYPSDIRTTGMGIAIGMGRLGAILGPTLFGFLSDQGLSISLLFSLFSLPLLITAGCISNIKSNTLT